MFGWSGSDERRNRRAGIATTVLAFAFAGLLSLTGCGDDEKGVQPDVTPPVITSGPTVNDLSAGGARITWTTDEASNSVVRYGPDTTLTFTSSVAFLTVNHSVWLLSGIFPDSTVYYRVESTDAALNVVRGDRLSFVPPQNRMAFDPETVDASAGTGFSVDLTAEGLTNVFGIAATVTFDPAVLRCDSVKVGPFLHADEDSVLFLPDIDNGAGTVGVGVTRYGTAEGAHGDGVIATLHFTAVAAGTDTLRIRDTSEGLEILDPSGEGQSIPNLDLLELGEATVSVTSR